MTSLVTLPDALLRRALSRRGTLRRMAALAPFFAVPGAFAELLSLTPRQTEGPFYPDQLPLDTDNDLLVINDSITPAVGEVTWFSGRLLSPRAEPVHHALVEIWQCDSSGVYLHSRTGGNVEKRDTHFQCFGRCLTGANGEYLFRTIKPVPYPGRTPHIHVKVKRGGRDLLTTQCYIAGHPQNQRDGIWNRLADDQARAAVTVPFDPLLGSKIGELAARFDIVLGTTPSETPEERPRGRAKAKG